MAGGLRASLLKFVPAEGLDRPVFIISAPRTGSTLLFECLRRFHGMYHVSTEADGLWWQLFPYERAADPSDHIGADEATPDHVRALTAALYWSSVGARSGWWSPLAIPLHLATRRRIRYLDKTVANAFHLDFLARAFPDALYVHLVRDPRATISSMIEGWAYPDRFGKPQLTGALRACVGASIEHWAYPAPPGWCEVVIRSLPEICAWSWLQHTERALDFFERQGPPVATVRHEEFLSDTPGCLDRLAERLGLQWTREAKAYARDRPLSRTAVSEPAPDKWRGRNGKAIAEILPMITRAATRTGYAMTED